MEEVYLYWVGLHQVIGYFQHMPNPCVEYGRLHSGRVISGLTWLADVRYMYIHVVIIIISVDPLLLVTRQYVNSSHY